MKTHLVSILQFWWRHITYSAHGLQWWFIEKWGLTIYHLYYHNSCKQLQKLYVIQFRYQISGLHRWWWCHYRLKLCVFLARMCHLSTLLLSDLILHPQAQSHHSQGTSQVAELGFQRSFKQDHAVCCAVQVFVFYWIHYKILGIKLCTTFLIWGPDKEISGGDRSLKDMGTF